MKVKANDNYIEVIERENLLQVFILEMKLEFQAFEELGCPEKISVIERKINPFDLDDSW